MSFSSRNTDKSGLEQPGTEPVLANVLAIFDSYPYLITRIVPALYHIILVPRGLNREIAIEIGSYQAQMNDLSTCLVFSAADCVYYRPDGIRDLSHCPPRGGNIMSGALKSCFNPLQDPNLACREMALADFKKTHCGKGYICGDLSKGGKPATPEELLNLRGRQANGAPIGLTKCPNCGDWRGQCLDPAPEFEGLIMEVHCFCDNRNRCAACGELLAERKLNGNNYEPTDDGIWHWPGFKAFSHRCNAQKRGAL